MKKLANTIFANDQIFLFMQLLQSPDKNQCKKTGWARTSLEQRNKPYQGIFRRKKNRHLLQRRRFLKNLLNSSLRK
jgi:hypothetical protein